jgi:hypothetical protein
MYPPLAKVTTALHRMPAESSNSEGMADQSGKIANVKAVTQNQAQVIRPGDRCHSSRDKSMTANPTQADI